MSYELWAMTYAAFDLYITSYELWLMQRLTCALWAMSYELWAMTYAAFDLYIVHGALQPQIWPSESIAQALFL